MFTNPVSVAECAKYLGVTVQAVHKMIKNEKLKARKVGNYYIVDFETVLALKAMRDDK